MSFKTIVEALVAFIKAIFGGKKSTTVQQTIVLDPSKEMSERTIQVLVQGHPTDEQGKIRKYIAGQEAKGIYNYVFETSRWRVTVKEGVAPYGAQFHTGVKEQEGTSY